MAGDIRINDLVSYVEEPGKIFIVTDVDNRNFRAPDWEWLLDLKSVGSGGGIWSVPEKKVHLLVSAHAYDRLRKRPEDLPDPRLQKF